MAATTMVSATSWAGAESSRGGAANSAAASAPPMAPTVMVAFCAARTRSSASSSPVSPWWCSESVVRSLIGILGAMFRNTSASHRPRSLPDLPARPKPPASFRASRPSSLRRSARSSSSGAVSLPTSSPTSSSGSPWSRERFASTRSGWERADDSWTVESSPSSFMDDTMRSLRVRVRCPRPSGGTLPADLLAVLLGGQLTLVVHQEALGAGELVGLSRNHPKGEFLVRQVGAGQIERLGEIGLVDVDAARGLVGPPRLEFLKTVLVQVVIGLARAVVVRSHCGYSISLIYMCRARRACLTSERPILCPFPFGRLCIGTPRERPMNLPTREGHAFNSLG